MADPGSSESFSRLGDRVWFWQGDLATHEQTNVGVVVDGDALVVVDANFGWAAERIVPALGATFGLPISHVANTHHHVDHSLGNDVFVRAGATVVGAAGQRAELLATGPDDALVQVGERLDSFSPATLEFDRTLTFPRSGLELHAVPPAHTACDLVAWVPADSVLFVGDLAVNWEHGNNFSDGSADVDGWLRALEWCLAREPRVVVPAHGRVGGPEVLQRQHAFITAIWAAASEAVASGRPGIPAATSRRLLDEHPGLAVDVETLAEMAEAMVEVAGRPSGAV